MEGRRGRVDSTGKKSGEVGVLMVTWKAFKSLILWMEDGPCEPV